MPSLKDLKNRIASVKSTQKITAAMKMVAASKLRRAQEQAEAGRPYAERMGRMLTSLAANVQAGEQGPKLMTGTLAPKCFANSAALAATCFHVSWRPP